MSNFNQIFIDYFNYILHGIHIAINFDISLMNIFEHHFKNYYMHFAYENKIK